jgi:hypothetical protein
MSGVFNGELPYRVDMGVNGRKFNLVLAGRPPQAAIQQCHTGQKKGTEHRRSSNDLDNPSFLSIS